MVMVQPANVSMEMVLQQAVPLETSPISREYYVRLGEEREQSVMMGDLPVGHLESVPMEVLRLGTVSGPGLLLFHQASFALLETVNFPWIVHNLSWVTPPFLTAAYRPSFFLNNPASIQHLFRTPLFVTFIDKPRK